jgi:hypothetical protein
MWRGQFDIGLKFYVAHIVDYVLEVWVHLYLAVVDGK